MRYSLFTPRTWAVWLCSAAAVFFSASALADPPARVARLTQISGTVSFSPAGEQDWEIAPANRPVVTGDRLWADARSHAELQIGAASARLGDNTAVTVLNLDDSIAQFQLAQGSLNVRVRRISGDQFYEVDTPNLAFSIRRVGDYRVDVDPDGNTTVIQVRSGEGEAWGEGAAYVIDSGQQYTFSGEGLRDYRYDRIAAPDEFDRWCSERNRREDAAVAARYVSPEMVGYSDLDDYGTWRNVEGYGTVWVPTQVAADWVPYHYGHWGWVDPWGWTWIDDAPWGFAPFHYGRWAYVSSRWCWVPGPVAVRPVYAPALVAFVGGGGFSLSISSGPAAGIAWFPLGVGEVYRPSYEVSRNYFTQINVTNTVINTTYVTNVYNNPNVQVNYRNREVTNAVTAVPANAFASGEPVSRHAVQVQRDVVERQPVAHVAPVAPTHTAVLAAGAAAAGAAAVAAAHRPPERVLTRQVVARTQPPAPPPSFAARSSLLSQQPGRPLDTEKMRTIRTERPAEAPRVKMVAPSVTPRALDKGQAKAAPTGPGAAGQAQDERAARERGAGPQPGGAPQPPASAQERFKGGPPQGQAAEERGARERGARPGGPQGGPPTGQPQEERAARERGAGPQPGGAPQPPASAQERFKGGPPQGQAAQERGARERGGPPGGPQGGPPGQAQEERAARERGAGPQPGGVPQPPPSAQERSRGGPPGGEAAQRERAQQQQQERAQQERAQQGRAQQERAQQERAQQERAQQQQQERAQQQQGQQRAQQERAQQERAQQERAQQERAQQQRGQQERAQQERAQQERAQQQQAQQRGQQERAQQERAQQQQAQQRAQQQEQAQQQQRAQQQAQQAQQAQQERGQRGGQGRGPQEKDKDKEKERGQPSQ